MIDGKIFNMEKINLKIRKKFFTEIYNILIKNCDANLEELEEFVLYNAKKTIYPEWRFQGNLGFGGKYYASTNRISCYSEDLNPDTLKILEKTNNELKICKEKYF